MAMWCLLYKFNNVFLHFQTSIYDPWWCGLIQHMSLYKYTLHFSNMLEHFLATHKEEPSDFAKMSVSWRSEGLFNLLSMRNAWEMYLMWWSEVEIEKKNLFLFQLLIRSLLAVLLCATLKDVGALSKSNLEWLN